MSFYTPSIPQAGDDPKVSQAQIQGNFGRLNTDFNVDHVQFTSSINRGQHRKITFQDVLAVDPNKAADIASLYTKLFNSAPELFFQNNNAASDVYQLTNLDIASSGTRFAFTTPWGIKIHVGQVTASPISFAFSPFDAAFTPYTAILTGIAASNPKVSTFTNTQITYTPAGAGNSVYYIAMGSV